MRLVPFSWVIELRLRVVGVARELGHVCAVGLHDVDRVDGIFAGDESDALAVGREAREEGRLLGQLL